jgi:hypothetical protein
VVTQSPPLRLLGPFVRDNWPGRLSCILVRPCRLLLVEDQLVWTLDLDDDLTSKPISSYRSSEVPGVVPGANLKSLTSAAYTHQIVTTRLLY